MNAYEQFKSSFLLHLETLNPELLKTYYQPIIEALDIAAFPYEVTKKETSLAVITDPLPQLVKIYLVVKKTEGLSDGTLKNYYLILTSFFRWCNKQPEEVIANDIRMFLYFYQQERNISSRTLDKYREMICWFFNWAHKEEYLSRNPAISIKAIKYEQKERQALTQLELEYLRLACKNPRDKAILEFFYSTGCRVTELIGVKKEDIDWKNNSVHLFGKGQKHRTSFINAKCEVTLKEYLKAREDNNEYLFVSMRKPHNQLTKSAIEKIIKELANSSAVTKHVTPHILRHTTATQAVNNGMAIEDVSKLLGHKNVTTTMVYAKVSQTKVHAEHRRCVI